MPSPAPAKKKERYALGYYNTLKTNENKNKNKNSQYLTQILFYCSGTSIRSLTYLAPIIILIVHSTTPDLL